MPTRYTVDLHWDKVTPKDLKDPMKRKKIRFQTRVKFEEKYVYLYLSFLNIIFCNCFEIAFKIIHYR